MPSVTMAKRVAIIGGGCSGLVAIKSCFEEGLTPVCFERTKDLGGLWRYAEKTSDGQGCVMKSTVINTSKEMMCYSDFPIPDDFPNFMHNSKVIQYFIMYAKKHNLEKYVKFETEIISVEQAPEYAKTGQWILKIRDNKTNDITTETYDAVMLCTGHHAEKNMAKFEGEEEFQGKRVHTHDYRDHRGYEDKRVVVIGIGNSGGDVAVELSRICSQVYLSTRRGSWCINRIADNGSPADMLAVRRVTEFIKSFMPDSIFNTIAEFKLNSRFDHAEYGLKPAHRFNGQHPMVNDELPNRIACGTVTVKPNVRRFTKTGIEFDDGSVEDNIDTVVYATGFTFGFPYINLPALEVKNNKVELFKYAFPPDLEHPTLCVIGFIQPWGAIMPISELQCRWAARLFKGDVQLPSKSEMWADIRKKQRDMDERYVASQRHTVQVDWIPFMDEVAMQVGCKPDLGKLFWQDPKLALTCFFGPCTPYQYRVTGPGVWPGARQAIMTQWERVAAPMKTRLVPGGGASGHGLLLQLVLLLVAAVFFKWFIEAIL